MSFVQMCPSDETFGAKCMERSFFGVSSWSNFNELKKRKVLPCEESRWDSSSLHTLFDKWTVSIDSLVCLWSSQHTDSRELDERPAQPPVPSVCCGSVETWEPPGLDQSSAGGTGSGPNWSGALVSTTHTHTLSHSDQMRLWCLN